MRKNCFQLTICAIAMLFAASVARAGEISLSAAASLKDALTGIADEFIKANPSVTIQKNFGASGALAKQIENGAPADIFISANEEWVTYLLEKNLLDKSTTANLAYNKLVFVGSGTAQAESLKDLVKLERIAIGSPKSVPAGQYAMESIRKAGLEAALEKKLILAKDVRECLLYAERGEVDGAFVYRTDALLAQNVRILFTVPQELYPRVTYPMGLTMSGAKNGEAAAFSRYLQSAVGKETLQKYGFEVQ